MKTMKRVLMDIDTNLFRLALLENGEPVEFYVERKQTESLVGNVYAGRVETVVPNLQAAFVDIGTGKNGYLYYGNARAASGAEKENRPKAGDTLVVQVEKDAVGTKGAVLTRNISFAGKFLEKLPMKRNVEECRKSWKNCCLLTAAPLSAPMGREEAKENFKRNWKVFCRNGRA